MKSFQNTGFLFSLSQCLHARAQSHESIFYPHNIADESFLEKCVFKGSQ